jgi:hypothetical protein
VIVRVDDTVVLTEKLVASVARDLTESVVDVGDTARDIGYGHDSRVVERAFEIRELITRRVIVVRR